MRRFLLIASLVLLPAATAFADPDIGCGPGTQLWRGSKGIPPKVLGATTNGSTGLQTFGISFGTLGCNQGGTVTAEMRLRRFTDANLDALARDMAQGRGETLATFAHLYGVADADRPAFYGFAQRHFGELFSGDDASSRDVLVSLDRLLAADPQLAVYARSGA
ncbi:MAG TPA: DUF3015 family protein [Myxococcota bacterium]|jgi:hypothetical protein|nr:DUF3015 family protein [Myxococcota bacterium]